MAVAGAIGGAVTATATTPAAFFTAGLFAFAVVLVSVTSQPWTAATVVHVLGGAGASTLAMALAAGTGAWALFGAVLALAVLLCSRPTAEDRRALTSRTRLASAATGAVLLQAAMEATHAFGALDAWRDFGRSSLLGAMVCVTAGCALWPAHVGRGPSPLEARRAQLMSQMRGPLLALAFETRKLFDACIEAVNALERIPGRQTLVETLERIALDNLTVCAHWSGLDGRLSEVPAHPLDARKGQLEDALTRASDPVVVRQLQAQLQLCEEQSAQLAAFAVRRERAVSRVRAQLALLERARLSLWMASLGDVAAQLADGEQLARTLEELSELPRHEAEARADLADPLRAA